ncbi:flavin reductase family protein [Actinoplanes sp. NPDC049548]|uniref:flavin reductase family protein n=1 Tax=Actinoplanes sp. NPDC049548 TaxID=3155152 RepID=UPI003447D71A
MNEPGRAAFRRTVGAFPTGVTLVTALTPAGPWGMTVSAFTSVSLDPLLVLVSLAAGCRLGAAITDSGMFAVSVLPSGATEVARRFAAKVRPGGWPAFRDLGATAAPVSGCPMLESAPARFDCRVHAVYPAGDHELLLGEVVWFDGSDGDPLVFAHSRYAALEAPRPVH